jgi:predicted membrane channel-forming protein YqfA (hemolysin III family)
VRLNAPTKIVFYIAVALMVVGIAIFYLDFFDQHRHIGMWSSTAGGMLLAAGSYFKGF